MFYMGYWEEKQKYENQKALRPETNPYLTQKERERHKEFRHQYEKLKESQPERYTLWGIILVVIGFATLFILIGIPLIIWGIILVSKGAKHRKKLERVAWEKAVKKIPYKKR